MTTTLAEQIEEMRVQMHRLARREQELVGALGQTLKRADAKLLQAVHNVAIEHELRRQGILGELQALAARVGTLPLRKASVASLENVRGGLSTYEAANLPASHRSERLAATTTLRDRSSTEKDLRHRRGQHLGLVVEIESALGRGR